MSQKSSVLAAIKVLLRQQNMTTQQAVITALKKQGHSVNQSTVSRMLRKLGVVKALNAESRTVYLLPAEKHLPAATTLSLDSLVQQITHNEQLIIVRTLPGSANVIARMLDLHTDSLILGTIAGDDTVLVVPTSVATLEITLNNIKKWLKE